MNDKEHRADLVERFNGWQPDPTQSALLAANRRILELEADLARWQRIARDRLRTLKAERKARGEG